MLLHVLLIISEIFKKKDWSIVVIVNVYIQNVKVRLLNMLLISQFKGIHRRDVTASSTGTLWPAAAVN